MSYEYKDEILDDIGSEPNSIAQKDSDNYYNKINELNEVYTKAEAFDALQEGLNELIDEYDKKAREKFENGFIVPATEALDIKKKIKNIVSHESEAE